MVVDGGTILRCWYPGAFWCCPGGFGGAVVVAGALPVAGFRVGHWTAVHGVFYLGVHKQNWTGGGTLLV